MFFHSFLNKKIWEKMSKMSKPLQVGMEGANISNWQRITIRGQACPGET